MFENGDGDAGINTFRIILKDGFGREWGGCNPPSTEER